LYDLRTVETQLNTSKQNIHW